MFLNTQEGVALFPGPTKLSVACSKEIAMERWVGPGNKSREGAVKTTTIS